MNSFYKKALNRVVGACIFVCFIGAFAAVIISNSPYKILLNIGKCEYRPPGPNYVHVGCDMFPFPGFYRQAILFLNIEPHLSKAVRGADVIVTGNSTTIETFAIKGDGNLIDQYFENMNLKFFLLAEDGSGFRFRKMVFEHLEIKPKIVLMNIDDLASDVLQDANREIIFNPEKFEYPFKLSHFAIELQKSICDSNVEGALLVRVLEPIYCRGEIPTQWRNIVTGGYINSHSRSPTKRMKIENDYSVPINTLDVYKRRMNVVLKSEVWRNSCIILYQVPGPSGTQLGISQEIAKFYGLPFVNPEVTDAHNYYVYDGSHMEEDTAKRWTAEFLKLLDPHMRKCLG